MNKKLSIPNESILLFNKVRLPGVQPQQSPFLFSLLFFFRIEPGTRISVGEISSNHQLQTCSRSLPQIWCTTLMIQHAEE